MTDVSQKSQEESLPVEEILDSSQMEHEMEAHLWEEARYRATDFVHAPIMSIVKYWPGDDVPSPLYRAASLRTQDDSARLTFAVRADDAATTVTLHLLSMMGLQFDLAELTDQDKRIWLDKMRLALSSGSREVGDPVFLWSVARWEGNYLIFVPQFMFVSVQAFSPRRHQAFARITCPLAEELLDWLEARWFSSK